MIAERRIEMVSQTIKVIDAHTHVFPDKIADKSKNYVGGFYGLPMYTIGTSKELTKVSHESRMIGGKEYKITHQLICSPAVTALQTDSINEYISELVKSDSSLIGFGTLHPDNENFEEIIDSIIDSGLKGIKFHSDFQRFNIDDKKMYPIYKYASQKHLPILFHMGDEKLDFSRPFRLARVIEDIPDLKIIAAHAGGYSHWDESINLPVSDNLYFDISSSLKFISKEQLTAFLKRFGYTHFFFGSDFPMWNPYDEIERFISLGFDEEIQRAIEFDNFSRFIGLNTVSS